MKKQILVLVLAALLVPVLASATVFNAGENLSLDQQINENVFAAGGSVRQSAPVNGDLTVAGGNLFFSAPVSGDLTAGGGEINILAPVGEDLRLVGGNLSLGAPVQADASLAGGQIIILPEGRIGGDLTIAGGQVTINGPVTGDVAVRAGKLVVGERAVIDGRLTYYSGTAAEIATGAQIRGGVDPHVMAGKGATSTKSALFGLTLGGIIFKLLLLFICAWVLSAILGAAAPRLVANTEANFWRRLGWGFLVLILAPILAVALFVTAVGIPLGLGVLALYLFLLAAAYVFTVLFAGSWLLKWLGKRAEHETGWKSAALGAIALVILSLIPIIGWIIGLILFIASLGAVSSLLFGWLKTERQ